MCEFVDVIISVLIIIVPCTEFQIIHDCMKVYIILLHKSELFILKFVHDCVSRTAYTG